MYEKLDSLIIALILSVGFNGIESCVTIENWHSAIENSNIMAVHYFEGSEHILTLLFYIRTVFSSAKRNVI